MGNVPLPTHNTWTKGDKRLTTPAIQGRFFAIFVATTVLTARPYEFPIVVPPSTVTVPDMESASILCIKGRVRANNSFESCLGRADAIPARRKTRHEVNTFIIRL